MQIKDVMTAEVVTVAPDTPVREIAEQLLARRISGVPVVDAEGRVMGIVSEGDLLRRPENETEYTRSWWLKWFSSSQEDAAAFLRSHGLRASQIMTRGATTIAEDAALSEAAKLMETRHIKRLPVVRDGKLVGIVSRANLLHGLVAHGQPAAAARPDDQALREQITAVIEEHGWSRVGSINVIVSAGMVELWGLVESAQQRQAMQLAAERIAGEDKVKNNVGVAPPYVWST